MEVLVLTDMVLDPEPVTEVGLKPAVAPEGKPPTLKPTTPENPPDPVTVAEYDVPPPAVTVAEAGVAAMAKSPITCAFTVSEMVVVCVVLPDMPVMVTVEVPVVAVALAVKVTELVDVVGLVPKFAVTPEGRPEADKVTLPVNPPDGVTVMVLLPLVLPCVTLKLEGEADRVKFGEGAGGGRTQLFAAFENSNCMV